MRIRGGSHASLQRWAFRLANGQAKVLQGGIVMRAYLIGAAAVFALSAPAAAEQDVISGNYFLPGCRDFLSRPPWRDPSLTWQCAGFVKALFILGDELPVAIRFCLPPGATLGQTMRIVVSYMDKRPDLLHRDLVTIAGAALSEAFPCR
jgi:hypothetical protein